MAAAEPIPVPDLATDRLRLRAPALDDVADIARLANDFAVARWLTRLPHPYGEADARFYLTEVRKTDRAWAITAKAGGALMGVIGLAPHGDADAFELGYWLGRAFWGKGFASEAGRAVLDHAARAHPARRIVAGHFAENAASARVLAKLGFVETGRGMRYGRAIDASLPHVDMALR